MESIIYLNENFLSCDTYVKVSVELRGRGVFSVVYNPRTKKIQKQKCITPYNFKSIVEGRNPSIIHCKDFDIKTANVSFDYFKKENLNYIQECLKELTNSFKQYECLDKNIDFQERQEILHKIKAFELDFANEVMKEKAEEKAEEKNKEVETWENVDATALKKEELCELANKISEMKNPISGVEFNGNRYRILKTDDGELCLQVKTCKEKVYISNANISKEEIKTRKFISMAKMINAEGLTEFINGNFYEVKNTVNFNTKSYFILKDDKGIEHSISALRLKPVMVYSEPPTE